MVSQPLLWLLSGSSWSLILPTEKVEGCSCEHVRSHYWCSDVFGPRAAPIVWEDKGIQSS